MPQDVPSPIDLRDPVQARIWVAETVARRPWRPAFFRAFCDALKIRFAEPPQIIELGSGPGHLAAEILAHCVVASYAALDFSEAMHDLARTRLGPLSARVCYVTADFRDGAWVRETGRADAVLTMQAAHETRHKAKLPALLGQIFDVLRPGGWLFYCDHYADEGGKRNPQLYLARDEQPRALKNAGFTDISCLLDRGGMALFAARRSKSSS